MPPPPGAAGTPPASSALGRDIRQFDPKKLREVEQDSRPSDLHWAKTLKAYGLEDDEDKTEYKDADGVVDGKCGELVRFIRESKRMVAYTGAGISTSAGIPDFRSPDGVWTAKSEGRVPKKGTRISDAKPTIAHIVLARLYKLGVLKFVVTTNGDALHNIAGLPFDVVADLHGSRLKGFCPPCARTWPNTEHGGCPKCGAALKSSGVGFGGTLPPNEWEAAKRESESCDLALVLGTSLRVSPACNLVEHSYHNGGRLVIVNFQKTPYDKYAQKVIRAPTDAVMAHVAKAFGITV